MFLYGGYLVKLFKDCISVILLLFIFLCEVLGPFSQADRLKVAASSYEINCTPYIVLVIFPSAYLRPEMSLSHVES